MPYKKMSIILRKYPWVRKYNMKVHCFAFEFITPSCQTKINVCLFFSPFTTNWQYNNWYLQTKVKCKEERHSKACKRLRKQGGSKRGSGYGYLHVMRENQAEAKQICWNVLVIQFCASTDWRGRNYLFWIFELL